MKKGLMVSIGKMLIGLENIESTLSCLSCLSFLDDPLMLTCGHSICRACFTTHSDPKSRDSIVFCEECKLETKNKDLHPSQVIKILCTKYAYVKQCHEECLGLMEDK